jgi:stage IV sporulation protein FB
MAWEDRRSYRDPIRPTGGYWAVLNGTVPLVPFQGIRVGLHSSFLLTGGLLLIAGPVRGSVWQTRVESVAALFVAALWHELAHLKGRRWSGDAGGDQIVLTAIGGMPAVSSHWRLPSITALLAGPAASLLMCLGCAAALTLLHSPALDPRHVFSQKIVRWSDPAFHLGWLYTMSLMLVVLNLLPIYPLDFGQVVHVLLARRSGYERSVRIVCAVGMAGSIALAIIAVALQNWLLLLVAANCGFFVIYLLVRWLHETAGAVELSEGLDDPYSPNLMIGEALQKRSRRRLSRWTVRRLRRLAKQEELEQLQLDAILAKVSKQGLASLTRTERRALRRATDRQRAT